MIDAQPPASYISFPKLCCVCVCYFRLQWWNSLFLNEGDASLWEYEVRVVVVCITVCT